MLTETLNTDRWLSPVTNPGVSWKSSGFCPGKFPLGGWGSPCRVRAGLAHCISVLRVVGVILETLSGRRLVGIGLRRGGGFPSGGSGRGTVSSDALSVI